MTNSSKSFSIYCPCPRNQKIKIVDETLVNIAGQGNISISPSLTLKNVLHYPKLSTNLLLIHHITKDLNCLVKFIYSKCVFQDHFTRKMIGHASEKEGLYFLEAKSSEYESISLSYISEEHITNKTQIWLSHFRLSHPSFSFLKRMFPTMFGRLAIQIFHYDACEFIKHHRVSFPSRNNKCYIPLSLIHTDVWGSTRIQSISKAKWFVSVINDCTKVTWVFLMKHKSDVSTIFRVFHTMVKTQFDAKIQTVRSNNRIEYFNQCLSSYFEK